MENPQTTEKLDKSNRRLFDKIDTRIDALDDSFFSEWDKIVDLLFDKRLINILKARGIEVRQLATKMNYPEKDIVIDVIAMNDTEAIAVDIKATLKSEFVDEYIEKLQRFKSVFKKFSDMKIYGAMAFLRDDTGSARYAEKQGLFVIKATGDSAKIINRKAFTPVEW